VSYGGSPSCGFDLINSDGSEYIPERIKRITCKKCEYFCYQIHHNSYCSHKPPMKKGVKELRDGRAVGCDERKAK